MQEKKYVKTIVCAISCVISGSMIGVLGLIIVLCSMLLLDSKLEKKYKIRFLILMIVAVLALIYVYNSNLSFKALIDYYIQRSMSIESSSTRSDSSFSQRIMGNSELFDKYNILNKFVGVGFNQYSLYFEIFKDYSNDFVSNLLNFGYIGIISMITVLLIIFRRSTGHGRVFALIFILLLSVDHAWFGTMFFYILTWVIVKSDLQQTTMYLRMRL
ncbi:MAG: hypothetical protein PHE51_10475 [Eubacteriales bacterium]|nr:hypothetical protein [Eubacteriales bacterium]